MKIRWTRERQYHEKLGLIETGREIDTEKDGILKETAESWVKDGWAEEIKPKKEKKEVKENERN